MHCHDFEVISRYLYKCMTVTQDLSYSLNDAQFYYSSNIRALRGLFICEADWRSGSVLGP